MITFTKPKNFDLDQIYKSGQCFRWKKCSMLSYKMPIADEEIKISEFASDIFSKSDREDEIRYYFDLDTDYLDIETEAYHTHDQYLIKCYEFGKGIRILRQDLWETLITFIISQNNNIPRIKKSVNAIDFRVISWEFAESKPSQQSAPKPMPDNDGFMNIPDNIDEDNPFN